MKLRLLVIADVVAAAWYLGWLLQPSRVGNAWLFGALVAAEAFNLLQAVGFWWTVTARRRPRPVGDGPRGAVDIFIPTYGEPVEVVGPVVAAARRLTDANVWLLDDAGEDDMVELADRWGVRYVHRLEHTGAKAGNINHALGLSDAPLVAVFDCDHVVDARFLDATRPLLADPAVAFVQTPQYYANETTNPVARAAWSQQALFFGEISAGKDRLDAMFCCGTNVLFRRAALDDVGGFPEDSITEDFALSVRLHERGWKSAYLPEVLARGLGPEDMRSYVTQQLRWSRGCISAIPAVVRARLPRRIKLQYLLSASFFLTGWTFLLYMALPCIRIFTGVQPVAPSAAPGFLVHFAPYFMLSLSTLAAAGDGAYAFGAYALFVATFWVHIAATLSVVVGRTPRFKVTPKRAAGRRQPLIVLPAVLAALCLSAAVVVGLMRSRSAASLNNVAFAAMHVVVLSCGFWPAFVSLRSATGQADTTEPDRSPEPARSFAAHRTPAGRGLAG